MFENKDTFKLKKQRFQSFLDCPDFATYTTHNQKEIKTFEGKEVVFDSTVIDIPQICKICPYSKECLELKSYIHFQEGSLSFLANTAVRFEKSGQIEIIHYNNNYKIPIRSSDFGDDFSGDRSSLYQETAHGLVPVKDSFSLRKAYESIHNSEIRSLQKFYNYALANEWEYFITLTFDPQFVDRYNRDDVVEKWSTFQKFIKRKNPDAKILVAPEPHEDGALHFHGFISNIPNVTLVPAFNQKTSEYIYNSFTSLPTLNLKDWPYGFSTVDVILPDSNQLRVSNYLSKYITKTETTEYRKKRYFHTRNLDFCSQTNYLISQTEFEDVIDHYNLEIVKSNSKFTVYRGVQKSDT